MNPLLLLDMNPDYVISCDQNGNIRYVNDSFSKELGYKRQDLVNESITKYVYENDLLKSIDSILHPEKPALNPSIKSRFIKKNGKDFPVLWKPIALPNEGILYLFGINKNQEQKNAHKKKGQAKDNSAFIDKVVQECYIIQNHENNVLFASSLAKNILGLDENVYFGKDLKNDWWQTLQLDKNPHEGKEIPSKIAYQLGIPAYNILMDIKVQNQRKKILINSQPFYDKDENIGSVTSFLDISALKEIGNDLIKQKEEYDLVFKTAKLAIWDFNPKNESINGNQKLYNIFGLDNSKSFPAFSELENFIHQDDKARVIQEYEQSLKNEEIFYISEFRIIDSKGRIKYLKVSGVPFFNKEKELIKIIGITQDITEHVSTIQKISLSEKRMTNAFKKAQNPSLILNVKNFSIIDVNESLSMVSKITRDVSKLGLSEIQKSSPLFHKLINQLLASLEKKSGILKAEPIKLTKPNGMVCNLEAYSARIDPLNPDVLVINLVDITESIKSEIDLLESNRRFEKAQAMGKIANFEYDIVKKTYWVSDEGKRIYGYNPEIEEFSVEDVWKCIPDTDRVQQAWVDLIENDKPYNIEHEIRPVSGPASKFIKAIAEVVKDETGNPIKVVGFIQDITDIKTQENELRKSYLLTELSLDLFCIAGYDGYFKYLNPAWERTLGYSTEKLLTTPWIEFVHPEDRNKTENVREIIVDNREVFKFENRYICKNGDIKWLSWSSHPLENEQIMIGAARDITEEKVAQQNLEKTNYFLNESQRISKTGGWLINLEKKELHWSNETFRIHDLEPDEYKPTLNTALNFYEEESLATIKESFEKATTTGEGYDLVLKIKTAKDKVKTVRTTGEVSSKNGRPVQLSGIIQDISELENVKEDRRIIGERFLIAQDLSPDGFTILKPVRDAQERVIDFTWIYQNPMIAKINGTDPEKVVGQSLLKLFPGLKGTQFWDAYTKVAETKEPMTFEDTYVGESIETKEWFRIRVVPTDENIAILSEVITKRKNAEDAIIKLNSELQKTELNAKIGGWSIDTKTMNTYLSKGTREIYEIEPDKELLVEEGLNFYHPEDRPIIEKAVQECLQNGTPYNLELRFITAKGNKLWLRVGGAAEIENDEIIRISGFINDITHLKEAQHEIKKLSKAVEQSPISIVITNLAGKIEYVNPKFTELSGYSIEEVINKSPGSALKSGHHDDDFYKTMWKTISAGNEWQGEFLNKKKSGQLFWEKAIIGPLKNDDGKTFGYIATKEDITDKKKILEDLNAAKRKAESSERFLMAIIENVSEPIFVKDENSKFILCNEAFCRFLNMTKDEILGHNLFNQIKKATSKDVFEEDRIVLETGIYHEKEEKGEFKKGRVIYYSNTKIRFLDELGNKLIIGTVSDTTDLITNRIKLEDLVKLRTKKLEETHNELVKANEGLKQSKKLVEKRYQEEKELGDFKSKLVSTVSHQFRTPLTVIQSNVNLLEMSIDQLDEKLKKVYSRSFDRIIKESKRMNHLMDDVLTLGRLNSGHISANYQCLDLIDIVEDITSSLNDMDRPSKIELEIFNKPKCISADPHQINHILQNILDNAQKYSLDRGNVKFKVLFEKDRVEMMIIDKGIGIEKKDLKKIFMPFTRGNNTEGIIGTGLGLAIVDDYIKLNNGTISFDSELDVGTTVNLSFKYGKCNKEIGRNE